MRFNWYMNSTIALAIGVALAFAPDASKTENLPLDLPVTTPKEVLSPAERSTSSPADRAEESTERALNTLYRLVPVQSHPSALRYAFEAYYSYRELNPEEIRKPYLYFVDFGLPSTEPRGYVFDMDKLSIVEGPFTVAHGRGSARGTAPVPTQFSNRPGSNATSLGLFVAAETYDFRGKSAGRSYRSVGLRMDGVSGGFNSAARRRGVVVHGAPYVTADKAGRSEGCPAMESDRAQRLLPMLAGGSLVFLYSPVDREWLKLEPWVEGELPAAGPNVKIAATL